MKLPDAYAAQKPLHRSLAVEDVAVQEDDGTFRITGRLVPYGVTAEIGPGVTETFDPGAFKRAANAPGRIKFRGVGTGDGHQDAPVIGHATALRDESDALYGDFKIVDTTAGVDTAKLLRSGVVDELSIEFTTLPDQFQVERRGAGIHVQHRSARLLAVAPVPVGAYGRDALVISARSLLAAERDAYLTRLRALRAGSS